MYNLFNGICKLFAFLKVIYSVEMFPYAKTWSHHFAERGKWSLADSFLLAISHSVHIK